MNISIEFEDEKDLSRNGWVIEKIVIIAADKGGKTVIMNTDDYIK